MNYSLHLAFLLPLRSLVALFISERMSRPIYSGTPDRVAAPPDASSGHEFAKEKKYKTLITLSLITYPRPRAPGYITFPYSPGKWGTVLETLAYCVPLLPGKRSKATLFCFFQTLSPYFSSSSVDGEPRFGNNALWYILLVLTHPLCIEAETAFLRKTWSLVMHSP